MKLYLQVEMISNSTEFCPVARQDILPDIKWPTALGRKGRGHITPFIVHTVVGLTVKSQLEDPRLQHTPPNPSPLVLSIHEHAASVKVGR